MDFADYLVVVKRLMDKT